MTKNEKNEVCKLLSLARCVIPARVGGTDDATLGYIARSFATLARSSRKSRNDIITLAAGWPAIVQHPDFIV